MYEVIFLYALALVWIIFAVVQDLKTREIANWLNFSLIIFALGFRFLFSLFSSGDFSFFYNGLIGFGIFLVLGNLFYYSKIFAGGDAKLMISLGAILPSYPTLFMNIQTLINFVLIFLFAGFVYILATSTYLCVKHFRQFKKEFARQMKKNKKLLMVMTGISVLFLIAGFFEVLFFVLGLLIFSSSYLYMYSKSIDEVCMVRSIYSIHLREGDWLYRNLKVGKNIIKTNWNGLSQKEIREIIKHYKKVKIRQGIPFSPNFLISFIIFAILRFLNVNLWNSFW
jgi:Flp pilus assembly protein protease CpaA